jgi:peptidoglycan/LPS O-acetylase OafA/YrhL
LRADPLSYRAEIDGLRAIAVLLVLGYHAFPAWVPGGFVGVDVFFVISGFLITRIILVELARGDFSLGRFYARRVRRIFPALVCVLLAVLAVGWIVLLPSEYAGVGSHVAYSAGFVQNHALWAESGYFATDIERQPLVHLWSLAVEEQFYLLWPLSLWLVWRRASLLSIVVLLAIVSFATAWAGLYLDPVGSYYLLPYRAWELLVGAGLATWSLSAGAQPQRDRPWHSWTAAAGAACIAAGAFWIDKHDPYPGWRALLPVAGSALCILAGPTAWVHRMLLRRRALVAIGLVSYPLYLWHWPLLSLVYFANPVPSATARAIALTVAGLLAWLTYVAVEKPVRAGTFLAGRWQGLVAAMALAGVAGVLVSRWDGFPQRLPSVEHISRYAKEPTRYPGSMQPAVFAGREVLVQRADSRRFTLFLGDSNMEQYYVRMERLLADDQAHPQGFIFHAFSGCLPMPGLLAAGSSAKCGAMMADALAVAADARVSTVVVAGNWNTYLVDGYGMQRHYRFGDATYLQARQALGEWIAVLVGQGKRVVVVLNSPIGRDLDPGFMIRRDFSSWPIFQVHSVGRRRADLEARYGALQRDLAKTALQAGAAVIDPLDHLCGPTVCPALDAQGVPMYSDRSHLRSAFVRDQVRYLDDTLR